MDLDDAPASHELTNEELLELSEEYGIRPQELDGETTIRTLSRTGVDPSTTEVENRHWLIHSNFGVEGYCSLNDVLLPSETTEDDLPPAENDAVHSLDKEALEEDDLTGKWNLFLDESRVDEVWEQIIALIESGDVWKAKVSTKWSIESQDRKNYALILYTPNYFDRDDVFRVRGVLRGVCGITETLFYKPDLYTRKGIYSDTAAEHGLDGASRYSR